MAALYINTAVFFKSSIKKLLLLASYFGSYLIFEQNICISDLLTMLACDIVAMLGKLIIFPVSDNLTSHQGKFNSVKEVRGK